MLELVLQGVLAGFAGTAAMDVWALIAKHLLRVRTADWALVGRWFGHMPKGRFVHRPIAAAPSLAGETALGWTAHYLIGAAYGLAYLYFMGRVLERAPSLVSALVFAWLMLVFPWLVMQPALGAGVFACRTPRPALARLVSFSMHTAFGFGLFAGWLWVR